MSECTTANPMRSTRSTARESISIELRPLFAGSESGNIEPMSPAQAAPRIASVSA
jgi:hypothetical protein